MKQNFRGRTKVKLVTFQNIATLYKIHLILKTFKHNTSDTNLRTSSTYGVHSQMSRSNTINII